MKLSLILFSVPFIVMVSADIIFRHEYGLKIKYTSKQLLPSHSIYGYRFGKTKALMIELVKELKIGKYDSKRHKCSDMQRYVITNPNSSSFKEKANLRLCRFDKVKFYLQKITFNDELGEEYGEVEEEEEFEEEEEVEEEEEEDEEQKNKEKEENSEADYVIYHVKSDA